MNTAGVPWANVQALRRRGVDAQLVVFNRYTLHSEADVSLDRHWRACSGSSSRSGRRSRDSCHGRTSSTSTSGSPSCPGHVQFPILARAAQEVRHALPRLGHPREVAAELAFGKKAGAEVVGSYDAIRWVPEAEMIPPGIDVSAIEPAPPTDRARPVILHAPSSRRRKGTEHVIAACEGLDADLMLVEGLHHDEAFERYREADIVVDQLNAGWYGLFAIECMALGKPVVTFLHEEAVARTEKELDVRVPIVSATRDTLRAQLEPLVASAAERQRIGAQSRAYVEQVHDLERVADRLLALYARL